MAYNFEQAIKSWLSEQDIRNYLKTKWRWKEADEYFKKWAELIKPKSTTSSLSKIKTWISWLGQVLWEWLATAWWAPIQEAQASQQKAWEQELALIQAIRANKAQGKDTSRLEQALKNVSWNETSFADIIPTTEKTYGQLAGDVASTALTALAPWGVAKTALWRIATWTWLWAASGAANALSEKTDISQWALKWAASWLIFSGAMEWASKLITSMLWWVAWAKPYTRTLKPWYKVTQKDLTQEWRVALNKSMEEYWDSIEPELTRQFQSFDDKIASVKWDNWGLLYKWTEWNLFKKATEDVYKSWKRLDTLAKKYWDIEVNKNEVVDWLDEFLESNFGAKYAELPVQQQQVIDSAVKSYAKDFTWAENIIKARRAVQKQIKDADWSKIWTNETLSTWLWMKNFFMHRYNDLLDAKISDDAFRELNKRLHVWLTIETLAAKKKWLALNRSYWEKFLDKMWVKLADNIIFNPWVTTRARAWAKTVQPMVNEVVEWARPLTQLGIVESQQ